MTARLRKVFTGKGSFGSNYDEAYFAGENRFDSLRDVVYDLVIDLLEDFGANLIKRSLSIIRSNTFGTNTLNKDAEVRDLRGA